MDGNPGNGTFTRDILAAIEARAPSKVAYLEALKNALAPHRGRLRGYAPYWPLFRLLLDTDADEFPAVGVMYSAPDLGAAQHFYRSPFADALARGRRHGLVARVYAGLQEMLSFGSHRTCRICGTGLRWASDASQCLLFLECPECFSLYSADGRQLARSDVGVAVPATRSVLKRHGYGVGDMDDVV